MDNHFKPLTKSHVLENNWLQFLESIKKEDIALIRGNKHNPMSYLEIYFWEWYVYRTNKETN